MKNNKGFTLVELIVVIAILAILGTIAFLAMQGYSKDARDSVRVSDMKNIETGLELFSIKSGRYPEPDNATSYSGGNNEIFKQGVFGDNATRAVNINKTPLDPKTETKYTYSVSKDGSYYQIGADKENVQTSIINTSYAVIPTSSIIKGNYKIDPSLPSLIVVPSSVTSSGVFDPNVCFVVDGGKNSLSNCVEKKKDMILKDFDNSLVGYWDMESYYQATYSGSNNVVFIKDLSGNGYDQALFSSGQTLFSSITTSSGQIFTGNILGKGIQFDNNNFKFLLSTISGSFDFSGRSVNQVPGNIFYQNYNLSGSNILPGMSSTVVIDYDSNLANNWFVQRINSFSIGNKGNIDNLDFFKAIDSSFIRFQGKNLYTHITPYNDGLSTSTGVYGLNGCGNNDNVITFDDWCELNSFDKNFSFSISGKNIITSNIDFNSKQFCLYINGVKKVCEKMKDSTISRIQEGGYKKGGFSISSYEEPFAGIIYDVKIYNRALTDQEIAQQARISGF